MSIVLPKEELIKKLQKEILDLQGFRTTLESELMDTGLGVINKSFPNHTFPVASVHEFISTRAEDVAATCGFISGLLSTLMCKGSCIWVSTQRIVFAPSLKFFGVTPDQVVFIDTPKSKDALWIIEEALKCEALACVVGEIPDLNFTESRRLQLAVEQSRVTGFIHRYTTKQANNVACVSRWHIKPAESSNDFEMPGIGMPVWKVELQKIRNGKPGAWQVTWSPGGFKVEMPQTSTVKFLSRKAV